MRAAAVLLLLAACGPTRYAERWNAAMGHEWKLQSLEGRPALEGTAFTLTLAGEGKLYGLAVNHYSARYTQDGPAFQAGKIGATRRHLDTPAGAMEQEARFFRLLASADGWALKGARDVLELSREGRIVLTFRR